MIPRTGFLVLAGIFVLVQATYDKMLLAEYTFQIMGGNLEWPCITTKNVYTQTGKYLPKNIIATRVQIFKDTAFIVTPRYKPGVPFTVGKVNLKCNRKCNPPVAPFSNFTIQEEGNGEAIQNAVDIFLDNQDLLWILDVGVTNTLDKPVRSGPPKIWAFDAKTEKMLKTIDLSPLVCSASRLQHIVVEYTPEGRAYVYVSDAASRSIVVYDVAGSRGFRVVLPEPVTQDCSRRDVLYIALIKKGGESFLYFSYLASQRMFAVKTESLRTGSTAGTIIDIGIKPTKFVLLGTDNGSNLIFRYKGESDILMWNTMTAFKESNFVTAQNGDDSRLATQVVSGFKKLVWVLESNFQDYICGTTGCLGASVQLHPLIKTSE